MGFIHDRLDMAGRVAVVTGAGRNLGRGIALGLADAGAAVVIAEIDEQTGPAMERELTAGGHDTLWVRTNVREAGSVDALVVAATERFGRLDVMVANAGGMFMAPASDISEHGFEAVLQLNLVGAWLCGQAAAKALIEAGHGGSIVNVSSINAIVGAPNGAHYGAAKAGILGLTRSLTAEWAEHGIRVNAIAPGGRRRLPGDEAPGQGQLSGGGDPEYIENVAAAVVYLASDLSTWVTGHTLVVDDGGTSTHAPPAQP